MSYITIKVLKPIYQIYKSQDEDLSTLSQAFKEFMAENLEEVKEKSTNSTVSILLNVGWDLASLWEDLTPMLKEYFTARFNQALEKKFRRLGKMKKYYQINFFTKPEVLEGYGALLTPYAREVLHSIFSMSEDKLKEELSKIPKDKVEAFYKSSRRTKVYVDEATNQKWLAIPWKYKKQAQYLITQKLLEKLKEVDIWK